jgi:hypothetical protein
MTLKQTKNGFGFAIFALLNFVWKFCKSVVMGQEEALGSSMHLPFLQCQENYLFHTDPSTKDTVNHSFQYALSLLCETAGIHK